MTIPVDTISSEIDYTSDTSDTSDEDHNIADSNIEINKLYKKVSKHKIINSI